MKTLKEYIHEKLGTVNNGKVPCVICKTELPLFALTRDDSFRWRCGHCQQNQIRANTPPYVMDWNDIRGARKVKLESSDWTEGPGARASMGPEKAAAWDAYRQALRDITNQECEPCDVVWPIAPN